MTDLISRQAAIEAFDFSFKVTGKENAEKVVEVLNLITERIKSLPSAQPERQKGEWDMFELITSAWYGKQCYFLEDNGMVYSRLSVRCMSEHDALMEFLSKIGDSE